MTDQKTFSIPLMRHLLIIIITISIERIVEKNAKEK